MHIRRFSCHVLSGVSIFVLDTMAAALVVPLDRAVAFLALATHRQTYGSGPGPEAGKSKVVKKKKKRWGEGHGYSLLPFSIAVIASEAYW